MNTNKIMVVAVLCTTAFMGGCASNDQPRADSSQYPSSAPSQSYSSYGVIDSIEVSRADNERGPGVGAVVGGLVGGLLGNQVGGGAGKTAATVAGAVGGAVVGNQVEHKNKNAQEVYRINVRLDNGSYQTVTQDTAVDLRVGNRVRIENGRAYRY